jgi:hypothetical protein
VLIVLVLLAIFKGRGLREVIIRNNEALALKFRVVFLVLKSGEAILRTEGKLLLYGIGDTSVRQVVLVWERCLRPL